MMLTNELSPVEIECRRKRHRRWFVKAMLLFIVLAWVYWRLVVPVPVDYISEADHFKYGSIGSDTPASGIPLRFWKVLPELFPEYLPNSGAGYLQVPEDKRTYLDGYASMGLLVEEGKPLPVGFSQRRTGLELVGLNCAVCHTSTVRVVDEAGMNLSRIYGENDATKHPLIKRRNLETGETVSSFVIVGMPANTVDLESYFAFLLQCAGDQRFTFDGLMGAVKDQAKANKDPLGLIEELALRRAFPRLRETLLNRRRQLHYLALLPHAEGEQAMPRFGPGRIDTFSPYKSIQFNSPWDGRFGIADYPAIWNQRPREGWQLHWDGNNTSVFERNISASIGAGVTPVSIDMHRMVRVARWLGSPPPPNPKYGGSSTPAKASDRNRDLETARANPFPHHDEMQIPGYPFAIDQEKSERGRQLFGQYCQKCHGWKGDRVGKVEDIADIGTDPARVDSYTEDLQARQSQLGAGQWWRFKNFRKTNGYANSPLDGVWARAPYLHNGSVPSLYDLMLKPCSPDDLKTLGVATPDALHDAMSDPDRVAWVIENARRRGLRPPLFYRGDDLYDPTHGGFRVDRAVSDDGRGLFLYSTIRTEGNEVVPNEGNGAYGHYGREFGTSLTPADKMALVEYQKRIGENR